MPDVRLIDANALKQKMTVDVLGGHKRIWVCGVIDDAPTIDAQPVKHGKWERTDMFAKCSECGVELLDDAFFGIHVFDDGYMPYCPNCGAKMKMN